MNKTFEIELPSGYEEVFTVDATDKKLAIWLNVIATIITVAGLAASVIIFQPTWEELWSWKYFAAVVMMIAYIFLHELTHGVAYKTLTGWKLTYGFTGTVAYCGVPDIFVYRKTALISLLAPFTVFTIIFLGGAFLLPENIDRFFAAALFAIHFGGCSGDLYDTWLFLTRLKDASILMQDTGPKQTFYAQITNNKKASDSM